MYIHREGHKLILWLLAIVLAIFAVMVFAVQHWTFFHILFMVILLTFWVLVTRFFRIPNRVPTEDPQQLIAPADGTIVTIEETHEKEYLNADCMQISIFMGAGDVHVNRYPCNGVVEYYKYQRGNYFIASYPKSSDLNEHTSVGMRLDNGQRILIRQIAGTVARRIVCYAHEGDVVQQNQEMGFIKFGSRVDIFVPKTFDIGVDLQDIVRNSITPLCRIG